MFLAFEVVVMFTLETSSCIRRAVLWGFALHKYEMSLVCGQEIDIFCPRRLRIVVDAQG